MNLTFDVHERFKDNFHFWLVGPLLFEGDCFNAVIVFDDHINATVVASRSDKGPVKNRSELNHQRFAKHGVAALCDLHSSVEAFTRSKVCVVAQTEGGIVTKEHANAGNVRDFIGVRHFESPPNFFGWFEPYWTLCIAIA